MHDGCIFQLAKLFNGVLVPIKLSDLRSDLPSDLGAQVNTVKRKPLRTGGWSTSAQEFRAAHEVNKLPPQLTPKKVIH